MTAALMIDSPPLVPRTQRTGFTRLTRVELRKAVDTRSGMWLLIAVGAVAVTGAVIRVNTGMAADHSLVHVSRIVQEFTSLLLPIIGILLVTSEWSQRTALQTFTLVPQRRRVIAAKLAAGVLIGLAASIVGLVIAAAATAAATQAPGVSPWHSAIATIGIAFLYQPLALLGGMAFGVLLLNSPLAIVLSFAVPIVWSILTNSISSLNGVANWLNQSVTTGNLLADQMTATHWAQLLVSAFVWVAVPLAVGLVRLRRKEIA